MARETTIEAPAFARAAEVRASSFDEGENTIEVVWTTGAKVRRYDWRDGGYYDEELVVDPSSIRLGRLNAGAPFLDTHASWELRNVIGSIVPGSVEVRGGKGYAKVLLSRAADDAATVSKIRDGIIRNISVGYRIHKVEKTSGDEGDVALWRVVDWEPMELSAVPIPADPGAQVRSENAAQAPRYPMILVRDDVAEESPAADAERTEGAETTTTTTTDTEAAETARHQEAKHMTDKTASVAAEGARTDINEAEVRAAAEAAERARVASILDLAERAGHGKMGAKAIKDGQSVEDFRAALLDELTKPKAQPPVNGAARVEDVQPAGGAKRGEAIANALLARFDGQKYKLDDAARDFRGMSLIEIARGELEANGVSTRGMSRAEIAGQALIARSGGMHSTSDFPFILANVANKTLRDAYDESPQSFRPLVRVTSLPDFKTVDRVQMGEAPVFEKVNEHGEFKRGTIGEGRERYALATYGKVVAITRQVIINDDLSAFTRVPVAFGRQAANLESDLVWAQIVGNPTMGDGQPLFHASHGNLGTASGITIDSIAAGREAMRIQKGLDGRTLLNIMPEFIIVPVAAMTKAEQLLTTITPAQISNAVPESMRRLSIISEPRLDGGFVNPATGQTVTGSRFFWYLAASPTAIDTVELAYLDGNQGVYTETRTGFDVDGVEVKVRMDVGAKTIDWRGFFRNPAAAL